MYWQNYIRNKIDRFRWRQKINVSRVSLSVLKFSVFLTANRSKKTTEL